MIMFSDEDRQNRRLCLLEDGMLAGLATLSAIEAGGLFDTPPEGAEARIKANHGCLLINMAIEHLTRIQQQIDALRVSSTVEG